MTSAGDLYYHFWPQKKRHLELDLKSQNRPDTNLLFTSFHRLKQENLQQEDLTCSTGW